MIHDYCLIYVLHIHTIMLTLLTIIIIHFFLVFPNFFTSFFKKNSFCKVEFTIFGLLNFFLTDNQ